jgi:Uma2 family endonuclease
MPTTALVTSERYLALPDEFDQNGNRIKDELIGGEIVKMPPASQLHDQIKNEINLILSDFLRANRQLCLKSFVEMGVRLDRLNTCVPDVIVIRRDRLDATGRIVNGAPELAIEVVSPSDTASHLKADQNIEDPLLPGFSTPVSAFFELI